MVIFYLEKLTRREQHLIYSREKDLSKCSFGFLFFFYAAYLGMAIGFIGSSPDAELSSENSRISSSVLSGCLLCCTDWSAVVPGKTETFRKPFVAIMIKKLKSCFAAYLSDLEQGSTCDMANASPTSLELGLSKLDKES